MTPENTTLRKTDRDKRRAPGLLRMFWVALKAWWNDDVQRKGASLAYYTLFAIAPILLVAIAIAGLAFGAEAVRGEVVGQMQGLVGRDGAEAIQLLLEGASEKKAGIIATILGGVTTLLAATGAFLELQASLNAIFRVPRHPGSTFRTFIVSRLRSFGIVIAIGFLLLVSLAVSATISAISGWMDRLIPGTPLLWETLNFFVSLAVATLLFAVVYRLLPDRRIPWRDVWMGAFATSVLFSIGKQLIGFYLGQSVSASTYGAAGSVIILLLWVYYSSQIVLLGAEYTRLVVRTDSVRRSGQRDALKRSPGAGSPATSGTHVAH